MELRAVRREDREEEIVFGDMLVGSQNRGYTPGTDGDQKDDMEKATRRFGAEISEVNWRDTSWLLQRGQDGVFLIAGSHHLALYGSN